MREPISHAVLLGTQSEATAKLGAVNSRSRVEAALQGAKVDRPPGAAWGHTYREEWSPEALAKVTVQRAHRYGWDFVKFQPRASSFAEAFGARYQSAGHSLRAPKEVEHPIHGYSDWPGLKAAAADAPSLAEQVEALRLTVAELGPDVPVLQTVFSPITVAGYLVGKESAGPSATCAATPRRCCRRWIGSRTR